MELNETTIIPNSLLDSRESKSNGCELWRQVYRCWIQNVGENPLGICRTDNSTGDREVTQRKLKCFEFENRLNLTDSKRLMTVNLINKLHLCETLEM